ncbi:hypothetical protein CU052_14085 [Vibrio harveyi]|nr:hypothetical protein CU052_14085 [Vibrio harveyi]
MTSLLMKPTSAGKDTRHKRDQPLKKLAYVSNHWGPLLILLNTKKNIYSQFILLGYRFNFNVYVYKIFK